jgi:peptide/nickel transport system substrate-binding protein
MNEDAIRELVAHVAARRLSRRRFVQTMVNTGLTPPLAAQLLVAGGVHAQPRPATFTPLRRGGGGTARLLYWQAATILNPHLATAVKD